MWSEMDEEFPSNTPEGQVNTEMCWNLRILTIAAALLFCFCITLSTFELHTMHLKIEN